MKKIYSFLMLVTLTTSISARVVFCDPFSELEDGLADTWENAVSPTYIPSLLPLLQSNDTICIKGGLIAILSPADTWVINTGLTVIGGYDPYLTGTDTTLPEYPASTPTVFDGDVDNDGRASPGDAEALIRVNLEEHSEQICTLQGLVLRNTYHAKTEKQKDRDMYMAPTAALRLICGTMYVKCCEIYNHSTFNHDSQSITIVGARAHFIDCDIHHGFNIQRNGLLRLRDYYINQDIKRPIHPSLVLERCCLHDGRDTDEELIEISDEPQST